jgi:LacI family transcriptional regulator/LacI family asc operon transcriptional repressor
LPGEVAPLNIYDIAEAAGVSIATVSRVLSGADHVRPSTRQRVLGVIEEKRYLPNAFARGLGLGSMQMVGILCTDVSDAFYASAVSIIERELRRLGLDALLYCTGDDLADKRRFAGLLLAKHVDAILLVGSAFKEQTDNSHIEYAASRVPVVIVNGLVECANTYCILCDESRAMYDNVRLLAGRGCRHIAYLYHAASYSGAEKLGGYRTGLMDFSLEFNPALIRSCGKSCGSAEAAFTEMLEAHPEIDAVLTAEDLLAVGAGKALAARGKSLPLIGFDNSAYAVCASPAITSVDNRLEELCSGAVQILARVLAGEPAPHKTSLPARLIERETFRTS